MAARFRLALVAIFLVVVTLMLMPLQYVAVGTGSRLSRSIPLFWHRMVLWCIGAKVHVHGSMSPKRPVMIVANHVSWFDITVLGSVEELCFIAKDEVKSWPGINILAKLQRTVFVNRDRKRDVGVQNDTIAARLLEGDTMVLFAEGTTGNGNHLMPFKSSLFGAPQTALAQSQLESIYIQPVAIAYNTLHGMPLGRYHQAIAAWPGDLELVPHLVKFVLEGAFDIDVCFGSPIEMTAVSKRKDIASETYAQVRRDFTRMRRLYHK